MATLKSSGLTLSSSYYLRNYYKENTKAVKSSYRKDYSNLELNYEDSRALRRASTRLSKSSYTENDNKDNIANSVVAYVETFNNTLESASSSKENRRYASQLKDLAKKYSDELASVGITVQKDGSMEISTSYISSVDAEKIGEIFSDESDFTKSVASISRKMNHATYNQIFANLTGTGQTINIVL
ncbi:MAG: hypothetical protein E7282_02780 [Lachnospiraceae bacterium]|nr:hypothetical protein [Lachnospiraceae bacterium]